MTNQQQEITAPDLRKYRTEIPNLYDDAGLDVYEFRLLIHYCRRGHTFEGTRKTAQICQMSVSTVSTRRRSLADKGYINLTEPEDETDTVKVDVVDIWARNFETYSPRSSGERPRSEDERPVRQANERINPVKKKPINGGVRRQDPEPKIKISNDLRRQGEELFVELTGLEPPKTQTQNQKRAAGSLWYAPIRQMLISASGDFETFARRLRDAVARMDSDDLTISTPKSVVNIYADVVRREKGNGRQPTYSREYR